MKSLELYEANKRVAALGEELRYYRNLAARQKRYIDTQMKPLVRMGIVQAGKIKTLERQLERRDKLVAALKEAPWNCVRR